MLLHYILLTQLRGLVPELREALTVVLWALRRLIGQVHSFDTATNLGILPGSRTVDKREIRNAHSDLIKGLSLLEGYVPIG